MNASGFIMRFAAAAALCASLFACSTPGYHRISRPLDSGAAFSRGDSFYVASANNGIYSETEYPFSGFETASAAYSALSGLSSRVGKSVGIKSLDAALKEAREGGFKILFMCEILHWEDRASGFSGVPDRAEVKVSAVEVSTGKVLDCAVIEAVGTDASFSSVRPADLIRAPISEYARSLFKNTENTIQK